MKLHFKGLPRLHVRARAPTALTGALHHPHSSRRSISCPAAKPSGSEGSSKQQPEAKGSPTAAAAGGSQAAKPSAREHAAAAPAAAAAAAQAAGGAGMMSMDGRLLFASKQYVLSVSCYASNMAQAGKQHWCKQMHTRTPFCHAVHVGHQTAAAQTFTTTTSRCLSVSSCALSSVPGDTSVQPSLNQHHRTAAETLVTTLVHLQLFKCRPVSDDLQTTSRKFSKCKLVCVLSNQLSIN